MSIVAMSELVGSGGTEIGRALAEALGWAFADREIITKAAESFGEGVLELRHAVEERPTLWDRFRQSQQRYATYVEATVLEMAARGNVVLVGRASPVILRDVRHALRVRVIAPERVRAERIEREQGLVADAALEYVRQADHDLAARVRFLYRLDWEAPHLYDIVLNTERLSLARGVTLLREMLADDAFAATRASHQELRDRTLAALARAALLANETTRSRDIRVSAAGGVLEVTGRVATEAEFQAAEGTLAKIPGVTSVRNGLIVHLGASDDFAYRQLRRGGHDRDRPGEHDRHP